MFVLYKVDDDDDDDDVDGIGIRRALIITYEEN